MTTHKTINEIQKRNFKANLVYTDEYCKWTFLNTGCHNSIEK